MSKQLDYLEMSASSMTSEHLHISNNPSADCFDAESVANTDWLGGDSYYSNLEEGKYCFRCPYLLSSHGMIFFSWQLLVCESVSLRWETLRHDNVRL